MSARPAPAGSAQERREQLAAALRARRAAPVRLAPNQERLFVLQELEPQSTAYAETAVLRLRGPLDRASLVRALRALPARHEWLRSRIEVGRDGASQVVDDTLEVEVDEVDLAAEGAGGTAGRRQLSPEAQAWVRSLAEEPLLLEDGPPWRAGVARLGAEDHLLVLVVHHIACDATSLAVLIEELGERYEAEVTGRPVVLPPVMSARDAARTIRGLQSSEAARAAVARAAGALADADIEARVPAARAAAHGSPGAADVVVRRVPDRVAERITRVAQSQGVTPFAVVSVAIGIALADAMDVDSPVLGVPVDLRTHLEDAEELVSFLVETVAVPLHHVVRRPLAEAATSVHEAIPLALAQPPPFDDVVSTLRRAGHLPPTGTPLHAFVTWLDGQESATLGDHGPFVTHVDLPLGQAKFDLAWTAVSRGREVSLRLEYDRARLDAEDAENLVAAAIRALDVGTRDPGRPVADIELLSAEELDRVRRWEGEPAPPPSTDLLTAVRAGVLGAEDAVLVTPGEALSGAELLARVDEVAAALTAAGVGPGDRVAVSSRRTPGMIVSLLAVLQAGGTFVPIDVSHPRQRQAGLARAAHVVAVVGSEEWAAELADAVSAGAVAISAGGLPLRAARPSRAPVKRSPDDLAYVMFTSGSTGRPKGVRVPDGAVVTTIDSYRQLLAAHGVRHLMQSTLAFDASIYAFWALATGGCLVLPPDEDAADPRALVDLVARFGVTDAFFVPGLYEAVLRVARPGDLESCRRLCIGGDVVPPALAELHRSVAPHATLLNVYGPTEAVVTSTATAIDAADVAAGRPLPIGRPHPGTVARVLDRHGRRVPPGAAGELHLGGPSVADGYDTPPEGPSGRDPFSVRPEPDGRALRWYATGDVVRWRDDGRLDYVGRRDRQVKLRGQRVELGEVEAALRRLPGVREAAVELVGDGHRRRLTAFVAPEVPDVRGAAADVLPAAWLPDDVVSWPELPHLPSGKLDRAALRAHMTRPPADAAPVTGDDAGAQTGLERTLVSIVRELLGDDGVVLDDDFFAVGGNSLLAARMMGQLSAMLGVTVPLHELVGNSTIRQIAALADRDFSRGTAASRPEARLLPVREHGSLPPAVLIARDGATSLVLQHFLGQIHADRPLWVVLRPMPPLDLGVPDLVADAAEVARVLLERFPDGPVHVLGHSASGLVTLETARRLGERRGAAILLDTVPPSRWSATPLRLAADAARVVLQRARLWRQGIRKPSDGDEAASPRTARAVRLYQDSLAAARTRMRPLDFPLTVLTSADTREALGSDDLGWRRWASHLALVPLPGDHVSLLLQPEVAETARVIDEVLTSWR